MKSSSGEKKKIKISKSPQKIAEMIVTGQSQQNINIPNKPDVQNQTNKLGQVTKVDNLILSELAGIYSGTLNNGEPHGQGIFKTQDGKLIYQGSWANGSRHGFGSYFYPDGSKYQGNWLYNNKQGEGIYTNSLGQKYSGNWMQNKRHGYGKLIRNDGVILEGNWQSDQLRNGKIAYPSQGYYEGQIRDYARHGIGTYNYPNGDKYIGPWKNNMKSGNGQYRFSNGDYYSGNFKDNFRHGPDNYYSWGNQDFQINNLIVDRDKVLKANVNKKINML